MSMHNLNLLPYDDVAKYGEEREDRRERRFPVNDEEGNIVDL